MILIIDNYDSFTYNLVHLVAAETDDYKVIRNDAMTLEEVRELKSAIEETTGLKFVFPASHKY